MEELDYRCYKIYERKFQYKERFSDEWTPYKEDVHYITGPKIVHPIKHGTLGIFPSLSKSF